MHQHSYTTMQEKLAADSSISCWHGPRVVTTLWRVGADIEFNSLSNEMSLERGVIHELKQRNKCIGPLKYYSLQPLEVAVTPTRAIEMEWEIGWLDQHLRSRQNIICYLLEENEVFSRPIVEEQAKRVAEWNRKSSSATGIHRFRFAIRLRPVTRLISTAEGMLQEIRRFIAAYSVVSGVVSSLNSFHHDSFHSLPPSALSYFTSRWDKPSTNNAEGLTSKICELHISKNVSTEVGGKCRQWTWELFFSRTSTTFSPVLFLWTIFHGLIFCL